MRISRDSDSDPCPVPDEMLGDLYRSSKNGLPELIATVSPDVRAALAIYCYRRGHLKGIGLTIASTCNLYDLETVGGTAGATLYARSREALPTAPVASPYVARQKITLASGSLRKSLPIDEDVELDDDAASEIDDQTADSEPIEAEATEAQVSEAQESEAQESEAQESEAQVAEPGTADMEAAKSA